MITIAVTETPRSQDVHNSIICKGKKIGSNQNGCFNGKKVEEILLKTCKHQKNKGSWLFISRLSSPYFPDRYCSGTGDTVVDGTEPSTAKTNSLEALFGQLQHRVLRMSLLMMKANSYTKIDRYVDYWENIWKASQHAAISDSVFSHLPNGDVSYDCAHFSWQKIWHEQGLSWRQDLRLGKDKRLLYLFYVLLHCLKLY